MQASKGKKQRNHSKQVSSSANASMASLLAAQHSSGCVGVPVSLFNHQLPHSSTNQTHQSNQQHQQQHQHGGNVASSLSSSNHQINSSQQHQLYQQIIGMSGKRRQESSMSFFLQAATAGAASHNSNSNSQLKKSSAIQTQKNSPRNSLQGPGASQVGSGANRVSSSKNQHAAGKGTRQPSQQRKVMRVSNSISMLPANVQQMALQQLHHGHSVKDAHHQGSGNTGQGKGARGSSFGNHQNAGKQSTAGASCVSAAHTNAHNNLSHSNSSQRVQHHNNGFGGNKQSIGGCSSNVLQQQPSAAQQLLLANNNNHETSGLSEKFTEFLQSMQPVQQVGSNAQQSMINNKQASIVAQKALKSHQKHQQSGFAHGGAQQQLQLNNKMGNPNHHGHEGHSNSLLISQYPSLNSSARHLLNESSHSSVQLMAAEQQKPAKTATSKLSNRPPSQLQHSRKHQNQAQQPNSQSMTSLATQSSHQAGHAGGGFGHRKKSAQQLAHHQHVVHPSQQQNFSNVNSNNTRKSSKQSSSQAKAAIQGMATSHGQTNISQSRRTMSTKDANSVSNATVAQQSASMTEKDQQQLLLMQGVMNSLVKSKKPSRSQGKKAASSVQLKMPMKNNFIIDIDSIKTTASKPPPQQQDCSQHPVSKKSNNVPQQRPKTAYRQHSSQANLQTHQQQNSYFSSKMATLESQKDMPQKPSQTNRKQTKSANNSLVMASSKQGGKASTTTRQCYTQANSQANSPRTHTKYSIQHHQKHQVQQHDLQSRHSSQIGTVSTKQAKGYSHAGGTKSSTQNHAHSSVERTRATKHGNCSSDNSSKQAQMQNLVTNFKQLDTLSQQQLLKMLLQSQKATALTQMAEVNHDLQSRGLVPRGQQVAVKEYSQTSSPEKQVNLQVFTTSAQFEDQQQNIQVLDTSQNPINQSSEHNNSLERHFDNYNNDQLLQQKQQQKKHPKATANAQQIGKKANLIAQKKKVFVADDPTSESLSISQAHQQQNVSAAQLHERNMSQMSESHKGIGLNASQQSIQGAGLTPKLSNRSVCNEQPILSHRSQRQPAASNRALADPSNSVPTNVGISTIEHQPEQRQTIKVSTISDHAREQNHRQVDEDEENDDDDDGMAAETNVPKQQQQPSAREKIPTQQTHQQSTVNNLTPYDGEPLYIKRNVVTKYAFATRVGFVPNNPYKVNQDSFVLQPNLNKSPYCHLFGVADGHGSAGREASDFIKQRLPSVIEMASQHEHDQSKFSEALGGPEDALAFAHFIERTDHAFAPQFSHEQYEAVLQKAFKRCDDELCMQGFDTELSGSTVVMVFFEGTRVICANLGDSRAVKCQIEVKNGESEQDSAAGEPTMTLIADELSKDHKLDNEIECQRVLDSGGRVESFKDTMNPNESIGPRRVWLPDQDIPGLAMSRSMGDQIAHSVGVSSVPEVLEFTLGPNDRFVVIGSDGLWEFLTNEEVCEMVLPYYIDNQPEAAANKLVREAHAKWKQEEEVVDDITVVVVFLDTQMAYSYYQKALQLASWDQMLHSARGENL